MSRFETPQLEQVIIELQNNPIEWNRLAKSMPDKVADIDIVNELVADYAAKKIANDPKNPVDSYLEKVLSGKEWCTDNIKKLNEFIKDNNVNDKVVLAEAAFTDLVIEKPKLKAENLQDKN